MLDPGPFGYIAGGAGNESTMRANLEAFERRRLRPRMLRGNAERDASVDVLGTPSPVPFFLAPIGVLSIAHPDGEVGGARAPRRRCASRSSLSSAASHSIEEIAEAMGDAPRWFQLYWVNDRDICASFVAPRGGRGLRGDRRHARHADARLAPARPAQRVPAVPQGEGCAQFFTDPVFCARLEKTPADDLLTRRGDDALHVPEPAADVGRPRAGCASRRRCRCS